MNRPHPRGDVARLPAGGTWSRATAPDASAPLTAARLRATTAPESATALAPLTTFTALVAASAIALTAACSTPRPDPLVPPTLSSWRAALSELRELRAEATGDGPRTFKLAVALREPFTGRRTEARGAVALSPADRAVRMILVGPGGTTAFDLWIRGDRFRVSIPAVDVLRRGDASTPKEQMRGLPVDFLRWWLLDPTRGDLLWADRAAARDRYVLREGGAITELLVAGDRSVRAERRTWTREDSGSADGPGDLVLLDEERVNADHIGCGRASYTQASTGVQIEITCEGIEPSPPSERAFVDPDAAEEEDEP